jgi:AcrR family transcriptional regulator
MIDEDGLEGFSIRGLGRELGVSGASLYYHFRDKDEVLHEVVKLILRDLDVPQKGLSWQEYVAASAWAYRQALMDHPKAAPLLMTRSWRSFAHDVLNGSVQALVEGGVPEEFVLVMFRACEMIGLASALFNEQSNSENYGEIDERYGALRRAIEKDTWSEDESFDLIVRALASGFASMVSFAPQRPRRAVGFASRGGGRVARTAAQRARDARPEP